MKYILDFFHMNEIYLLLYDVPDKLSYLNLQLNYIHRANFRRFTKNALYLPFYTKT